jgi:hypothetical protein
MALAEEHGQQIDGELVEQDRVDALPDDVSRTDADNVIAGDRCGLHHRTLDADGDQGQRRGRREPSRHVVSNHEDWHAS